MRQRKTGLIGLYGHTFVNGEVQYQFQIIRSLKGDRYVIQYFSFLDGSPTNLGVMSEAEMLGPDTKLYATCELWNVGYQKAQARVVMHRRRDAMRELAGN